MKLFCKKNIAYTVIFSLAALVFVLLCFPKSGETFEFLNRFFILVFGSVSAFIPFSVMTLLICLIPLFLAFIVWRFIVNKRRYSLKRFFLRGGAVLCVIFVLFGLILGLGYRRESIYAKMDLPDFEVTDGDVVVAADFLIDTLNDAALKVEFSDESRALVLPDGYDEQKIASLVYEAFDKQNFDFLYGFDFRYKKTFSGLLEVLGFDGVVFPLTAEINIDGNVSAVNLCVLLAHELLHVNGVLNEGEANFLSQYICIFSGDPVLSYCGAYSAVMSALDYLYATDYKLYYDTLQNISDPYLRMRFDYYVRLNANTQPSFFTKVANFFYDIYLKLNFMSGAEVYSENVFGWARFVSNI